MKRPLQIALIAGAAGLALSEILWAGEQILCKTSMAIFPNAHYEDAIYRVTLTATDAEALIHVKTSGTWVGRRTRHASGADTFVFDTGAATETMTIGASGRLLWEIAYKDPVASDGRVMFYIGECRRPRSS